LGEEILAMNLKAMTDNRRTEKKLQRLAGIAMLMAALPLTALAIESGIYRILSVSDSIKIILISQPVDKTAAPPATKRTAALPSKGDQTIKYVLDASAAKITVNGKPAEFKDLKYYAAAQVKFQLHKDSKEGIPIDGKATEIKIIVPPDVK
jgi:hypothetical protein